MSIANAIALKSAGVPIEFSRLLGMLIRKSLTAEMVEALTFIHEMNLDYSIDNLEVHALSGGNIVDVANAALILQQNKKEYAFETLMAADLADRPVLKLTLQYFKGIERDKYPEYRSYLFKAEVLEE